MDWYFLALLIMIALLVVLLSGVPIAVGLTVVTILFFIATMGVTKSAHMISTTVIDLWWSHSIIPLAFFIAMSQFLLIGGISEDVFDVASKWLRQLPGGLALVTVGACAVFATITGSSVGATATFGVLAIPRMLEKKYDKRLACGVVGAAGGLAHLIPPSILMIIYATMCELSVGQMFMAGFVPGLILTIGYCTVVFVWVRINPTVAPKETPAPWKEKLAVLKKASWPLIIVFSVLGSIFLGVATVTESAAVGTLVAFMLSLIRRRLTWKAFCNALNESVQTTCFIMFIAVGGKLLSQLLSYYLIPQQALQMLLASGLNRWLILVSIQVIYLILGMILDPIGMMYVTVPMLLPILYGFGFDPIWFGILLMINLEMAMITPPVGILLYVLKGIVPKDISLGEILTGCVRFFAADCSVLALCISFPQIVLWLPSLMIK